MTDNERSIPAFLEDAPAPSPLEADISRPRPLQKTFFALSFFWLVCVLVYLHFFYGWESLSVLMPSEFVLFLAGFFVCPLLIFLLVAYVKKTYSTLEQNEVVAQTLNKFLQTNDENLLSKIINKALQNQIAELNGTLQFLSAQTDILKKELNTKASDFADISETLQTTVKNNLSNLDENKNEYVELCRSFSSEAVSLADALRQNTQNLQESADALHEKLNPLIDETMVTANHLKTTVDEAQTQMAQTKSDLDAFTRSGKKSMEDVAEMLHVQTAKFEKAMLQTADSCEAIYGKIDSGISHIENSLKTHKDLASEQAALIDKNANFLDAKLGQYGKLISMEVSAMVERASSFDLNLKEQIEKLKTASKKIDEILGGANNSLTLKSEQAVKNINGVLLSLSKEIQKLSSFIENTEKQNQQVQTAAEKISKRIAGVSSDLGLKVDDLKLRSVEAIDRFNEVSAVMEKNTVMLSENANTLISKGKEGAEVIGSHQAIISKTGESIRQAKEQIRALSENLELAQKKSVQIFDDFKVQIENYRQAFDAQFAHMEELKEKADEHFETTKTKYQQLNLSDFMNQIAFMIENLENLSIDINRFFDKDSEDALWKKFYNGDHGAFANHMVKKLGRKEVLKIRELYETNADFREITDRYLREFGALLEAAEQSQNPQTVLAMLSSSQVGKIYYVMARALEKLD
ncbi:MAG: hypothetical protein J5895_03755 [Alphaproteobacteria bacterium]|nr:hypothetical protein [Alphaproteobacteria bacterium]